MFHRDSFKTEAFLPASWSFDGEAQQPAAGGGRAVPYFPRRRHVRAHSIVALGIPSGEAFGSPVVVVVGRGEAARRRAAAAALELLLMAA